MRKTAVLKNVLTRTSGYWNPKNIRKLQSLAEQNFPTKDDMHCFEHFNIKFFGCVIICINKCEPSLICARDELNLAATFHNCTASSYWDLAYKNLLILI